MLRFIDKVCASTKSSGYKDLLLAHKVQLNTIIIFSKKFCRYLSLTFFDASSSFALMARFKVINSFCNSSNKNFSSEFRELRLLNSEPVLGARTILVEPLP